MTKCWICNGKDIALLRQGLSPEALTTSNFAITNADYGQTLSIHRCNGCGFLFCPEAVNVIGFYEALEDQDYDNIRPARIKQAADVLMRVRKFKTSGTLLDVGAASGCLVEQALNEKFSARGIEPGKWFSEQAQKHNLPVLQGYFPHSELSEKFDIITLIDVVEHVTHPQQLLKDIAAQLKPDGIAVIGTPDVGSLVARVMGAKWYQFRIGHIGYFDRKTLALACQQAGLTPIHWSRPIWYFPFDFLWRRLASYLPFTHLLNQFAPKIIIPYNLRDNWMVIAKKSV